MITRRLTQAEVIDAARLVAEEVVREMRSPLVRLYGVPRGGVPAAYLVSAQMPGSVIVDDPGEANVIIDDLVDSGVTMARHRKNYPHALFLALFHRPADWLVFPWEGSVAGSADDIPLRLLQHIGEDITREGLRETPRRFLDAWQFYTQGYHQKAEDVLKTFTDGADGVDELVLVKQIPVWSHCEHHLAPFFGQAHVGYIPDGKVVGISKLARLVEVFARRLQVQERMTQQIAKALNEHLKPKGVGVVIECRHLCMEARGVRTQGATTVTSCILGAIKEDSRARAELLRLIR